MKRASCGKTTSTRVRRQRMHGSTKRASQLTTTQAWPAAPALPTESLLLLVCGGEFASKGIRPSHMRDASKLGGQEQKMHAGNPSESAKTSSSL